MNPIAHNYLCPKNTTYYSMKGMQLLKSQPFIESNASDIDTSFKPRQRSMCFFYLHFPLSSFNYSPSPLNFSKFQSLPLSFIPPNLSGTAMAKLPCLQLVATESHSTTTSGGLCWCGFFSLEMPLSVFLFS